MIIWVFVGTITIAGQPLQVAPDMKYAYATKQTCEFAIAESKMLKCIPLTLMGAR